MTQIGMLSTDRKGNPVAGDDEPTVVKAFKQEIIGEGTPTAKTEYTFVIKNGLKFSDGHPLTINDVMFNLYEYLDPVYTGSSTMYPVDIVGLTSYRTQTNYGGTGTTDPMEQINKQANAHAIVRRLELSTLYMTAGKIPGSTSYNLTEEGMRAAIAEHNVSGGYKNAVSATVLTDDEYRQKLLEDYEFTLKTFKEELESDYKAAKESFDLETAPYKDWKSDLSNDVFKFFLYEGYITPEYELVQGKKNKEKIVSFGDTKWVKDYNEKTAIERVYNDKVQYSLNEILSYWGTAGTLLTKYAADATTVILNKGGEQKIKSIEGIKSLGHHTTTSSVEIDGVTYNVAQNYDENGAPTNANEYAVLQITVDGTDPKAIYNFGFSVAPAHYYSADSQYPNGRPIDIANHQYGVEFGDSDFQSKTIQSQQHVEVPLGAGAFKATDEKNSDKPSGSNFWKSSIVYFKANDNFMFEVKADKLRMQVISSTNALDKLQSGEVDYVTPQFTKANSDRLTQMEKKGFEQIASWQLGYGYIGINAGKVPNVNIRRAIMSAMQTDLALGYYESGTCKTIDWPMSTVNWAYPFEADGKTSKPNGHSYTQWTGVTQAKAKIQEYMNAAKVKAGDADLSITFTIAGASITEHPTYTVFKQAAEILNDMGWDVEVVCDTQALTKINTGSLEVWAAAWSSALDPDMYQVYHKDSTATSTLAWGYPYLKASGTAEEINILDDLSDLIDEARETNDQEERAELYQEAMEQILDLAIELPVYQRSVLYAYNSKVIDSASLPAESEMNPYSSPLDRIWEVEFAK